MIGQKKKSLVAISLALLFAFLLAESSNMLFPYQKATPDQAPVQPILTISKTIPLSPISISPDGSIDPSIAPIQCSGETYILTEDLANYTILIQKDNIVFEGAGHVLQGSAQENVYGSEAICLNGKTNVTIKNVIIENFWKGIIIQNSSTVTIQRNVIRNGGSMGIVIDSGSNNIIANNDVNNVSIAITISNSDGSPHTTNNTITKNTVVNATSGIEINSGALHNITENKFEAVHNSIWIASNSTTISKNNIMNGIVGISIGGYYYDNSGNHTGGSYCSIFANDIEKISESAIVISLSTNSVIYENNILDNKCGITFDTGYGSVGNNTFYHNNFIGNVQDVFVEPSIYVNYWDNGKEGNYWSSHGNVDNNGDGITDSPYIIDTNDIDRNPLAHPYGNINAQSFLFALYLGICVILSIAVISGIALLKRQARRLS
jgi:nitrous oxidase accessory protein NosD